MIDLEERERLPLNGPSNYKVLDSCIYTKAMEINVTFHCNLSCAGCSHSSPIMKKQECNLEQLKNDLEKLSIYIKCDIIRLVGGEPLLHSNLKELIKIIKDSKISNKISLITNGTLLSSMDISVFDDIDELEVSLYPLDEAISEKIKECVSKIKDKFTKVRILEYDSFRIPFVKKESNNKELVQQIYDTCQIAHYWRCITIENGYLYRCPQSMINDKRKNIYVNGLKINSINSYQIVLDFLENNTPIQYCSQCLGSVGKLINHKQSVRNEWTNLIPDFLENSIDQDYMKEVSSQYNSNMKCMVRKKV